MGMFSWDCKACGHPALCEDAVDKGINDWMSQVVVLGNAGRVQGYFDGYGRVDGEKVHIFGLFSPCLYHTACWEAAGKPGYDGRSSGRSADQGWFFNVGDHDMLEPGVEHGPWDLRTAQLAREARLAEERRGKAFNMFTESEELETPWEARYSLSQRRGNNGYMLCDDLDGDWHPHDTHDEAVAHAEELWAAFVRDEVPDLIVWSKEPKG